MSGHMSGLSLRKRLNTSIRNIRNRFRSQGDHEWSEYEDDVLDMVT